MIYSFDTEREDAATGALLVYAVYRSRDKARYKVTPDLWGQIERFTKASAKRARSLPAFVEALKPRLSCATLQPRWMAVGFKGLPSVTLADGAIVELVSEQEHQREFMTTVFERANHDAVIDVLYRETSWVIALVRERLEREKPVEARFEAEVLG